MKGGVLERWAPLMLMMASGFAGLGYQIVWTQQSALWLGQEAAAVLAVVAAFFGGLGVGAMCLGPAIERSTRPARWYAVCELTIAAWSLVLAFGMTPVAEWMLQLIGSQPTPLWQWTVAFCGTFVLLLPATAAMGGTLPAMERIATQLRGEARSIATLYAANTVGAVLGVLCMAFWLVPGVGLLRTAAVCALLNLSCALLIPVLFTARATPVAASTVVGVAGSREATLRLLAVTGLLGIGYEVLVVRVLSQVTEDTVYTFAMLLAVYLAGSAGGAIAYQRWFAGGDDPRRLERHLLSALTAACLLGTASLWFAATTHRTALATLGAGMAPAIAAEAILALFAFGPATIVMGALFSHLSVRANAAGLSFGRAMGANTLGAAAAPLLFGVIAVPLLGPKFALLLIASGYLLLAARGAWRTAAVLLPAVTIFALAIAAPPMAFVEVPPGGRVLDYRDGVTAAVSVVADAQGVARLRINNRQQEGSSASLRVDGRQAWLPLLLHPAPQRALFLGLGTGVTASAATHDPGLRVDAVELLPEVIAASRLFTGATPLHVQAADARRFVRATNQRYDVIVADNFHPARSGSGSLYTVEHFRAVRERLAPEGLFCQWLPLHQLDLASLRSIVRSFLTAFPHGWSLLASNSLETPVVGLLGLQDDGGRFELGEVRARLARVAPLQLAGRFGIEDEFALLGSFIADPQSLARFAAGAPRNTDDLPVVSYGAPRITYVPDSLPADRLVALLQAVSLETAELLAPATDPAWLDRLASYGGARRLFIDAGRNVHPVADPGEMLAQVREPLLSVLRMSPDFRPAYDPLLSMAGALARTDSERAHALLSELLEVQPARPEAAQLLDELGATALSHH